MIPRSEKMTAVRAYLQMYRTLLEMNGTHANVISRRDNNAVFDMAWKCKEIARRILQEYDTGPHNPPHQRCGYLDCTICYTDEER